MESKCEEFHAKTHEYHNIITLILRIPYIKLNIKVYKQVANSLLNS